MLTKRGDKFLHFSDWATGTELHRLISIHGIEKNLMLVFGNKSFYFLLLETAAPQQETINIKLHKLGKMIWSEVKKCCLSMRNFIRASQLTHE